MHIAYETMIGNDVKVYSVKTDAFVNDKCIWDKGKEFLDFGGAFGPWRCCNKFNFPCQVVFQVGITEYF